MPVLSLDLRERTAHGHRLAESTPFVRTLLAGRMDRRSYVRLLRSLHAIYASLEPALHAAPAVATLLDPALPRADPLAADLEALHGRDWQENVRPAAAAQAYAAHLGDIAREQPLLLAAHAYVRYLGDLSGGQAIGRVVKRSFGLANDQGTRFYRFEAPPAALAQRLRSALDALVLDDTQHEALIREAIAAFARHERLFGELGAAPP